MKRSERLSAKDRRLLKETLKELNRQGRLQEEKLAKQHGSTSVYQHSINVAYLSLWLAGRLPLRTDRRALVRGALLHDYFLYDWHKNKIRPSRFYKFYELIQGRSIILAVNIPLSYVKSHPPPVFSTMWRTD